MPADLFPGENPFALVNLTDAQIDRCMPWAVPIKGKLPNLLRRGLVFQDGRRLKQVASRDAVSGTAGSYWVEPDGLGLCVRPFGDVDPARAAWEVTVLGTVFAPKHYGLGYVRVKGLMIEHCGNGFPRPQQGALSTHARPPLDHRGQHRAPVQLDRHRRRRPVRHRRPGAGPGRPARRPPQHGDRLRHRRHRGQVRSSTR